MSQRMPTLFISHGGGPWPYIPQMREQFNKTANWLTNLPAKLPQKPKAIISISGHWEESVFTVSTAQNPPMIYDYSGFPDHTYEIKYPAPGSPEVAQKITSLLGKAGIPSDVDPSHGFDHGTFVPVGLMYPLADVPVVSLSMKSGYDPVEHLKMGQAIAPLRDEGVLIIGSGLTYHNMRGFGSAGALEVSKQFGEWLGETISSKNIQTREQKLIDWEKGPAARLAHPREDHLLPLMVVVGAAGDDVGQISFVDNVMNVDMASYQFGS